MQPTPSSTASPIPPPVVSGACDTHVHVFDPARFPYSADRRYTPAAATVSDLRRASGELGIERLVLVQPSVYGTDNRCLLDALETLGNAARGIAVIDPAGATGGDLRRLTDHGVVGVRVNLEVHGEDQAAAARQQLEVTFDLLAGSGLLVELYVSADLLAELSPTLATAPVPVVVDHFGGVVAARGIGQPGFQHLLRLVRDGNVWAKLSAPYRVSSAADHGDVASFARALVEANVERLLWASDWPHTGGGRSRAGRPVTEIEPFRQVDDRRGIEQLLTEWTTSASAQRRVLAQNPAALFGF